MAETPTTSRSLVAKTDSRSSDTPDEGNLLFKDVFIYPTELFTAIEESKNLLMVDIRLPVEVEACRVLGKEGQLINIPEDLIIPGLSEKSFKESLKADVRAIWEKRDTFEAIVLMDKQSQKFTYEGSKLSILRSLILQWDTNKTFRQQPVVLIGGIEEYAACYSTEVSNPRVFWSKSNSEMDELLTTDIIDYPEHGSGSKTMTLRMQAGLHIGYEQMRIKRDFEEDESLKISISEGHLPRDWYAAEDLQIGPYESISQPTLREGESSTEDTFELELTYDYYPELIAGSITQDIDAEQQEGDGEASGSVTIKQQEISKPSPIDVDLLTDTIHTVLKSFKDNLQQKADVIKSGDVDETGARDENQPVPEESVELGIDFPIAPATAGTSKLVVSDGYTGLINKEHISYMNCLVQCLKVIPLMKNMYVLSDNYFKLTTLSPPSLTYSMATTLQQLWRGTYRRPSLYHLSYFKREAIRLRPLHILNRHQDIFEFFRFVFRILSDDCAYDIPYTLLMNENERAWYSYLRGRSSFLADNFYYQLRNNKLCYCCRTSNLIYEIKMTLTLTMPDDDKCKLENMMMEYLRDYLITECSCTVCLSSATVVNKKEIIVEPEVLVIDLKRFTVNLNGSIRKSNSEIEFPLTNFRFGLGKYKLYAIVHHVGSLTKGHYFATVLLKPENNTWAVFDDNRPIRHCKVVGHGSKVNRNVAGLFYVREKYGHLA